MYISVTSTAISIGSPHCSQSYPQPFGRNGCMLSLQEDLTTFCQVLFIFPLKNTCRKLDTILSLICLSSLTHVVPWSVTKMVVIMLETWWILYPLLLSTLARSLFKTPPFEQPEDVRFKQDCLVWPIRIKVGLGLEYSTLLHGKIYFIWESKYSADKLRFHKWPLWGKKVAIILHFWHWCFQSQMSVFLPEEIINFHYIIFYFFIYSFEFRPTFSAFSLMENFHVVRFRS